MPLFHFSWKQWSFILLEVENHQNLEELIERTATRLLQVSVTDVLQTSWQSEGGDDEDCHDSNRNAFFSEEIYRFKVFKRNDAHFSLASNLVIAYPANIDKATADLQRRQTSKLKIIIENLRNYRCSNYKTTKVAIFSYKKQQKFVKKKREVQEVYQDEKA